jgi:hypothetical protein
LEVVIRKILMGKIQRFQMILRSKLYGSSVKKRMKIMPITIARGVLFALGYVFG